MPVKPASAWDNALILPSAVPAPAAAVSLRVRRARAAGSVGLGRWVVKAAFQTRRHQRLDWATLMDSRDLDPLVQSRRDNYRKARDISGVHFGGLFFHSVTIPRVRIIGYNVCICERIY